MKSRFTPSSALAAIWLTGIVAAGAVIALKSADPDWIRSSLFDLLPHSDYESNVARAVDVEQAEASERLVFLVGHRDQTTALRAGTRFASDLSNLAGIEFVDAGIDVEQTREIANFYFPYRRQLLTGSQMAAIEADSGERIEQSALAAVFSIIGTTSLGSLTADPFSLFPESLRSLQSRTNRLRFQDGFLWADHDSVQYLFISARANSDALSIDNQAELVESIDSLTEQSLAANPGLSILATGYLIFSHAGTERAKSEISLIGTGSILGIIALILFSFRSVRPLGLAGLSIVCGCISALAVSLLIFGSLHVFTLIFGASLIGVSIDYSFHFISECGFAPERKTTASCRAAIFSGITLGLMTSSIAYLSLLSAPLPGLHQLAVFSATGLLGAYLTILICAKRWARPPNLSKQTFLYTACERYIGIWSQVRPRHAIIAVSLLAVLAVSAIPGLRIDDSVGQLQSRPPELVAEENTIAVILGETPSSEFILIEGPDAESVLSSEERVREVLDRFVSESGLNAYQAISRFVPSRQRQAASELAYDTLIENRLESFYTQLGFESITAAESAARLAQDSNTRLTIDDWMGTSLANNLGHLWLGAGENEFASIIQLQGVADSEGLSNALSAFPEASIVDRQTDIAELFSAYRERISIALAIAYLIVLVLLATRYGLYGALFVLIPPVAAGLIALVAVSFGGGPINLFNILAVILVLGIGIDFTLFTAESSSGGATTMFAITHSAATTLLSFGLLSLSTTYAVQSFGSTILVGIAIAYLLAPLATLRPTGRGRGRGRGHRHGHSSPSPSPSAGAGAGAGAGA